MKLCLMVNRHWRSSRNTVFVVGLTAIMMGCENNCQTTTSAWQQMELTSLVMVGPDNQKLDFQVKLADSKAQRSAGFQYICPSTFRRYPIYFKYGEAKALAFHMRNVTGELEIAFIDKEHRIDSIKRMVPYKDKTDRKYYLSNKPAIGALEAYPGFFSKQGITAGWTINLQ